MNSTPMSSFLRDPTSPQDLIRRFVHENIETLTFPSLSGINISNEEDTNEDTVQFSENEEDIVGSSSPSLSLSLPESFDIGLTAMANQLQTIQAKNTYASAPPPKATYRAPFTTYASAQKTKDGPPSPSCTSCLLIQQYYIDKLTVVQSTNHSLQQQVSLLQSEDLHKERFTSSSHKLQQQEIMQLETRLEKVNALLSEEQKKREGYEYKALRYEENEKGLTIIETEKRKLQELLASQQALIETLTKEKEKACRESDYAVREKELLSLDKNHLIKETDNLKSQLEQQRSYNDQEKARNLQLESRILQLEDHLLQVQARSHPVAPVSSPIPHNINNNNSEEFLVQRVRDEMTNEVDYMRRLLSDLQRSKDYLETEILEWKSRYTTAEQTLGTLRTENTSLQNLRQQEVSTLRAENHIFSFENTSLKVSLESVKQEVSLLQRSGDQLKEENFAYRSAISRLETEITSLRRDYEIETEKLSRQIKTYEALEVEIDETVLQMAAEKTETATANAQSNNMMLIKGIPAHPERRIQQAVYLAQRLLASQRQVQSLEHSNKHFTDTVIPTLTSEKEALTKQIHRMNKPAYYLVNKLQQREVINQQLTLALEKKTDKVKQLTALLTKRDQEVENLKYRLQLLLKQRGELQTVKMMIGHLHSLHAEEDDEDSEDEEEGKKKMQLLLVQQSINGKVISELDRLVQQDIHDPEAAEMVLPMQGDDDEPVRGGRRGEQGRGGSRGGGRLQLGGSGDGGNGEEDPEIIPIFAYTKHR